MGIGLQESFGKKKEDNEPDEFEQWLNEASDDLLYSYALNKYRELKPQLKAEILKNLNRKKVV